MINKNDKTIDKTENDNENRERVKETTTQTKSRKTALGHQWVRTSRIYIYIYIPF